MQRTPLVTSTFLGVVLASTPIGLPVTCHAEDDTNRAYGLDIRTQWKGSRVIGSPEPPAPFITVDAFPKIDWDRPLYAKPVPDSNQLIVVQQGGEKDRPSKLLSVEDRRDAENVSVVLEMPERLIYGLEFHPHFRDNGFVYVFSNGPTGQPERKNRISRFTVLTDGENQVTCKTNTEQLIIEWRSMGHDGGDIVFGRDGMLYATSGDGTSDSDNWLSAQDVTNLLGAVLRIDVDHPGDDRPYSIPPDNPFVDLPGARGELWAIGLRNPWRMTIDSDTGQIWVGSNGQDLWESVNLLGRGENYGWSVYEGSHPFYAQRQLGPGKLTFPTFEHHHTESRSLTGGVVYDGDHLATLKGAYVYGDYSTGKIWAGRHDGNNVTSHREIADTSLQIAGFANSHQGELLVVDHTGGIYRLEVNPATLNPGQTPPFPDKLSATGIFESVSQHRVAAGVLSYSVNCAAWNDGATVDRYMAIPDDQQIEYAKNRGWNFPDGTVLLQTLSLPIRVDGSVQAHRIETRILTRQQGEWAGYSYHWNPQQDDAILVGREGKDLVLPVVSDQSPSEPQPWRIPARAQCMSCHARAVNFVLGMTELQMNCLHNFDGVRDNQLRTLEHIGMFTTPIDRPADQRAKLPNPFDSNPFGSEPSDSEPSGSEPSGSEPSGSTVDLTSRVKAYLHTNCSGCHVAAGGGNSRMDLEYTKPLEEMKIVSHFPQHDTFGIPQPLIVAPGEPDRSVMLSRLQRRGRGQMPPLVSRRVDRKGVELIRRWMASMESDRKFVNDWKVSDLVPHLGKVTSGRSFKRGEQLFRTSGCVQCHRMRDEFAGIGPNLTDVAARLNPESLVSSIVTPSAVVEEKHAQTMILTVDGRIFKGRVASESDDSVVLRGAESFSVPVTIEKSDIEQRRLSRESAMPSGTINHLDLEQILDLLAYLQTGGDPNHPAFTE